jgi:iron complex transport system substrate-binding protein
VRVVTLLPAGTEIVAALGGAGYLVGISHECDYPRSVQPLPRVTTTSIDTDASSRAIDVEVRALRQSGQPVIGIDADHIHRLRPDLIIAQGLCDVCAVSDGEVIQLASGFRSPPQILSLAALDLQGIWADIRNVADAIGLQGQAEELVNGLQGRVRELQGQGHAPVARVLCVEWLDPLYLAGHWVPDLVKAAGGIDIGARAGSPSIRREWAELAALAPDLIIVMLCGLGIERTRAELEALENADALSLMAQVPTWILDGNQYTSRPGPRVVAGAEHIRAALIGASSPEIERWQPAVRC